MISTSASSDELSDKSRFRYFLRLVPPDRLQAQGESSALKHMSKAETYLVFMFKGHPHLRWMIFLCILNGFTGSIMLPLAKILHPRWGWPLIKGQL